jgi:hypothetical protein
MTGKALVRLDRSVRKLPATPAAPPTPPAVPEIQLDAAQLAREAARAFDHDLARFRKLGEDERPPDPRQRPPDWREENARTCPPEHVSFADIERLGRVEPEAGIARWEEVKAAARNDLDTGWMAGRALEALGGSAWERACFAAVRHALREAWAPRNPAEAVLIDQMAQYEIVRLQWVRILYFASHEPRTILELNPDERPRERKLGSAGATLEAIRMVERLQRLYQGTLRSLLGMRRTAGPLTLRNTGPMNVALGPQLNVAVPAADAEVPVIRVEGQSRPPTECADCGPAESSGGAGLPPG